MPKHSSCQRYHYIHHVSSTNLISRNMRKAETQRGGRVRVADKSENNCQLHQVRFRCVVVVRRLDPFICILNYHVPIQRSCEDRIACPDLRVSCDILIKRPHEKHSIPFRRLGKERYGLRQCFGEAAFTVTYGETQ